jgi:hypothetical protein
MVFPYLQSGAMSGFAEETGGLKVTNDNAASLQWSFPADARLDGRTPHATPYQVIDATSMAHWVTLLVTPGSEQIRATIERDGQMQASDLCVRRGDGISLATAPLALALGNAPRTRYAAGPARSRKWPLVASSFYGLAPVVCATAGGRFISTYPDRFRCLTSRSAVMLHQRARDFLTPGSSADEETDFMRCSFGPRPLNKQHGR